MERSNFVFRDLYQEDRDLYLRDEKTIAEQYAFLESKNRAEFINFLRNNNLPKVDQQPKLRPDCNETEKFLPPGWEI